LNDMGGLDPMYQFSLDAYIELFNLSIQKSTFSKKLEERIANLNSYHTYAVYRSTCRGLFEAHKLLFSFHMCAKILQAAGKLALDEYNFFLRGGLSVPEDADRALAPPGPRLLLHHLLRHSKPRQPLCGAACSGHEGGECTKLIRPSKMSSHHSDLQIVLSPPQVVEESTSCTPLIFVLSPGVDPTGALVQLADSSGMTRHFHALSLGQGQAPIAKKLIEEGVKNGHWVFLANCHLSLSWMPELDELIKQLQLLKPHPNFRLWLSSSPHPEFPITILQAGIKMTTEPPKSKTNMEDNLILVSKTQFSRCSKPGPYRKLLFSLCFFHSLLQERKKFQQLGWNVVYDFNHSDFEVSENLLCFYLDKYDNIPWDALKHLIADIIYGGHVTDQWDRRLLTTYMDDFFCERSVCAVPPLSLSPLPLPSPSHTRSSYSLHIQALPSTEHPELFGQHPNADIASQIAETKMLFDNLLSMQPQFSSSSISGGAQPTKEDAVRTSRDATQLENGIKGFVVMSSGMEQTFTCIHEGRAYPSLKPLAAWTRDLHQRVAQFGHWANTAQPPILFWLSGFTSPNGFLTAVLQSYARHWVLCLVLWIFEKPECSITHVVFGYHQDGVFVWGLFLEGASWDTKNSCLVEPTPMQMVCPVPPIHFKPVKKRKKPSKSEQFGAFCIILPLICNFIGFSFPALVNPVYC
uniref:Dynein heavy chain region D6 P-loop domain-containing protein n=1 Tax=Oryzias latipes TaxID=8090 RepID=A0A3B3HQK6_ORYLA